MSSVQNSSKIPVSDEEAKRLLAGGTDDARCADAFATEGTVTENRPALKHFYIPTEQCLIDSTPEILKLLRKGVHIIIPMKEDSSDTDKPSPVEGVLSYCLRMLGNTERIVVIDGGSHEKDLTAVRKYSGTGVRLIPHHELLALFRWDKLLPHLHLDEAPTSGKGIAVMAGMLAMYLLFPKAPVVAQIDADLHKLREYDPLLHLGYPLTQVRTVDVRYVASKMARAGRGNETTMTARNMLADMARCPITPGNVQDVAGLLARTLREHKWMLTGEFALDGALAYQRPFATGYCEETLISVFLETWLAENANGVHQAIAQVESLNTRIDSANTARKEHRMMDRISRFLMVYARFGKHITNWIIEDYSSFNTIFAQCSNAARIPSAADAEGDDKAVSGPVIIEQLLMDRIIPPISFLWKNGFIDTEAAAAWKQKHLSR